MHGKKNRKYRYKDIIKPVYRENNPDMLTRPCKHCEKHFVWKSKFNYYCESCANKIDDSKIGRYVLHVENKYDIY